MQLRQRPRRIRGRRSLPCCVNRTRGKHDHTARPRAHDHATGYGFVKDRSTTKAVLERMEALGAW